MYDPVVETRSCAEQLARDKQGYLQQLQYLYEHSSFYRNKLQLAGFSTAASAGNLEDIHKLPFTTKEELRQSQAAYPPFGSYLAADPQNLIRIYSTSGTTGAPCYIGLTPNDLDMIAVNVARGYCAAGFSRGQRIVISANAGPFVAGASYYGFDKLGCCVIPVGTGNTQRLFDAIAKLGATGISCTPSYGFYLSDWCRQRKVDPRSLGLKNMITAGEPGGGDTLIRSRLQQIFGCQVREAMGIGDISLTVWAEDQSGEGMHLMARDAVYVELINPDDGSVLPWEDGVQGELVYTALQREAMPLLRFRSRDHVVVNMRPNPSGRTGPRVRCIGRTDDMLIVRGVNLFPTAIRSVLQSIGKDLGEVYLIKPKATGVSQQPPLPISIELAAGLATAPEGLAERIKTLIREQLLVSTEITLVPHGFLPRGEYKMRLVDFPTAG